jgi:hypothetical protein
MKIFYIFFNENGNVRTSPTFIAIILKIMVLKRYLHGTKIATATVQSAVRQAVCYLAVEINRISKINAHMSSGNVCMWVM